MMTKTLLLYGSSDGFGPSYDFGYQVGIIIDTNQHWTRFAARQTTHLLLV
jgi:hypothetical protein